MRTLSLRALGFYSSVEPTFVSYLGRCFLTRKILINAHILQDCSHFRIPLPRVNRGGTRHFYLGFLGDYLSSDGNGAGRGRRMGSSSLPHMVVALPRPCPASGCEANYLAPSSPSSSIGAP